jgi:hypothetical protein
MNVGKKCKSISSKPVATTLDITRSALPFTLCLGLCLLAGLSVPALAATLKSIMSEMKQTTTAAKGVLSNFDQTQADALLHQYATQAIAAGKLIGGGDAKAVDFQKRFAALAATANNARATNAASFHTAFSAIAAQCRSCHSAYK